MKRAVVLCLIAGWMLFVGLSVGCSMAKPPGNQQETQGQPDASTNPDVTISTTDSPQPPSPDTQTSNPPDNATPPKNQLVVINEIAASGTPSDWFELYNPGDSAVDLSGFTLTDDLNDPKKRVEFPKNTTIKAGEYKKFDLNNSWPGFKLGGDEELGLYDDKGNLVDQVDWQEGDSPEGKSYGRVPTITGTFQTIDTPTPGKAN